MCQVRKIHSTCRIANIGPDDAMILAQAANPDGSNFRKGHGSAVWAFWLDPDKHILTA
jgi:hypothetical protein